MAKQRLKHTKQDIVETIMMAAMAIIIAVLTYIIIGYQNDRRSDAAARDFIVANPLVRLTNSPYKAGDLNDMPNDLTKALAGNTAHCTVTEGRSKSIVLGVTQDKSQVLVGKSCGSTGVVRSFLIKQDGKWVSVGKFNEAERANFETLIDAPSCWLVEKYHIQKSIAPVCFNLKSGKSSLVAGDLGNYTYVVR
ncbi:MAG TPA: hypothetical protein VFL81_01850 [Candidatus Saccharimonadales bacterium]|nr:hypothetical protein [Candidatus Saccharimonadales bacterium]